MKACKGSPEVINLYHWRLVPKGNRVNTIQTLLFFMFSFFLWEAFGGSHIITGPMLRCEMQNDFQNDLENLCISNIKVQTNRRSQKIRRVLSLWTFSLLGDPSIFQRSAMREWFSPFIPEILGALTFSLLEHLQRSLSWMDFESSNAILSFHDSLEISDGFPCDAVHYPWCIAGESRKTC